MIQGQWWILKKLTVQAKKEYVSVKRTFKSNIEVIFLEEEWVRCFLANS